MKLNCTDYCKGFSEGQKRPCFIQTIDRPPTQGDSDAYSRVAAVIRTAANGNPVINLIHYREVALNPAKFPLYLSIPQSTDREEDT